MLKSLVQAVGVFCYRESSIRLICRSIKNSFHSNVSGNRMVKFLGQSEATKIDVDLIEKYKFSLDQLMELAGQSCAIAIAKCYPLRPGVQNPVLVCCGPGNNGGDGLVCGRHLKLFGYEPQVYYPKRPNNKLYQNLMHQCIENGVQLLAEISDFKPLNEYIVIIDALFGFSFKPPVRQEFQEIIDLLRQSMVPICSIDIPSGWDVEAGPLAGDISPAMLISLTAPKLCATNFKGKFHYLGGRFVPEKLEQEYKLDLPNYHGTDLVVRLK